MLTIKSTFRNIFYLLKGTPRAILLIQILLNQKIGSQMKAQKICIQDDLIFKYVQSLSSHSDRAF